MNSLSSKIGFWSAVVMFTMLIGWIVCFTGIALTSPLFQWTNMADYLVFEKTNNQTFQYIAKSVLILFGPCYVLLISSFYDFTGEHKKTLVRISLIFALAFAILSSLHYFVQLTSVRMSIDQGSTGGLEHFVQANPYSVMTSADMLGWTLFLGLSSLFVAPVFTGSGLQKLLRYAFLLNGLSCFLAGIGYLFRIDLMTFVFINLCVGGALLVISISSIRLFRQVNRPDIPIARIQE